MSFIMRPQEKTLEPAALNLVRRTLVDTVGVALAAAKTDVVRILMGLHESSAGSPAAALWHANKSVPVEQAALINGVAAHALDFDDVNETMRGHPSAVLWPAILAYAEGLSLSGRQIADAYVCGLRVMIAIADAMDIDAHYRRGWHATSTLGVIGAAAALIRLGGLAPEQGAHAFGLAVSMASGSRQNFGTMTKPYHAGMAARNAVSAVRLARSGFTASEDIFCGPLGFFALFGECSCHDAVAKSLSSPWQDARHSTSMKRFALCYNLHRICEATLKLRNEVSLDPVREIEVTIEPDGLAPLIYNKPRTGLEAKFSIPYAVAVLLTEGDLPPRNFESEFLTVTDLQSRLMASVRSTESAVPPDGPVQWREGYATVSALLASGKRHSARIDDPEGHWARPMTRSVLKTKFAECLAMSGCAIDAAQLESALWTLPEQEIFEGLGKIIALCSVFDRP